MTMTRIIALAYLMMCTCFGTMMAQDIEMWLTGFMERYPKARLLDIYKSCFQDHMGAEHLVGDRTMARSYLEQELQTVEHEDLLTWYYEPCGFNGNYVRVSLLAVKDGKIDAERLLDAFVRSANDADRPTVESWASQWQEILSIIEKANLALPYYQQDKEFIAQVLAQGKYAISHSPDYREAYSPHYRIIKRDIFEQEIKPLLCCACCGSH